MSEEAATGPAKAVSFHPRFYVKRPGDIIIQADDDDTCFYFRLALLTEFSSFFRDLPDPSANDIGINGTPVVPLIGSTCAGLAIFLDTMRTFVSGVRNERDAMEHDDAFVNATILAVVFDAPGVLQGILGRVRSENRKLLVFVVKALGYGQESLWGEAYETLSCALGNVTEFMETEMVERAPTAWQNLKDYHMRQSRGLERLRLKLTDLLWISDNCGRLNCKLLERLVQAEDVHQIKEEWRDRRFLLCAACLKYEEKIGEPVERFLSTTSTMKYGSTYTKRS